MDEVVIIGGKGTAVNIAEQIEDARRRFGYPMRVRGFAIDDPALGTSIAGFAVENKAAVLSTIFGAGLFASSHYANLADVVGPGTGQHARHLHNHVINLFNDYHFDVGRAEQISGLISAIAKPCEK